MAIPPLYILRHGETEWNREGRLQGRFDSLLTERGIAHAKEQHAILCQQDLKGFQAICSPQGRAQQTAQIALQGVVPELLTDESLKEIGLGEFAGSLRQEAMEQTGAVDGFDLYELAPGGEGFEALHKRCQSFLRSLQRPSVLITHGITSRMLRLILLGRPVGAIREIEGGQGVVFHLKDGKQHLLKKGA